MRNCELLKQFYEEQNDLIQLVDNLVLDTVKTGFYRNNNISGRHCDLSYRLVCTLYWIQLQIIGKDFVFEYSMDFNHDSWDCCQFFGEAESTGINFGKVQSTDKIWVQDRERLKVLQYPISEEQYFQNLTLLDLSSEELYKYFVDIKKDHKCVLYLTTEQDSDGINQFNTLLKDSIAMRRIHDELKMVELVDVIIRE